MTEAELKAAIIKALTSKPDLSICEFLDISQGEATARVQKMIAVQHELSVALVEGRMTTKEELIERLLLEFDEKSLAWLAAVQIETIVADVSAKTAFMAAMRHFSQGMIG